MDLYTLLKLYISVEILFLNRNVLLKLVFITNSVFAPALNLNVWLILEKIRWTIRVLIFTATFVYLVLWVVPIYCFQENQFVQLLMILPNSNSCLVSFNADFHYFKLLPFQLIALVSSVISINKPSVDIVQHSSYLWKKLNNSLLLLLGIH